MVLALLGSFLFVILGIWLVVKHQEIDSIFLKFPLTILIVGIISILFFGFLSIIAIKKLSSQTDKLIISAEGITNNSWDIGVQFIPWKQIKSITEASIANQNFVIIVMKNPEKFIASQKNKLIRKAMSMNYRFFGAVINLSANNLETTHKELKKILVQKLTEYNRMNII